VRKPRLFAQRFALVEQEKAFIDDYGRKFLPQRRLAVLLAFSIWCAFFVWDWTVPSFSHTAFLYMTFIRTIGICGFLYLVWISWTERFSQEAYASSWLVRGVFFGWTGLLAMMLISPPNNTFREYYPGLLLAYYFLFTVLRIRARDAAIVGAICFVAFNVVEYRLSSDPMYLGGMGHYAWFSSAFFLICFYVLGALVSSQLEISVRNDFLANRIIVSAQAEAAAASTLLTAQYDKMRELVAEKERFFSSAYHDIQQPLAIIGLYVNNVRKKLRTGDGDVETDLSIIERNSADIVNMFKGIHDYSELGSYDVQVAPTDLDNLLEEIYQQYSAPAARKGLTFKVSTRDRSPPLLLTDRALLKRLLANLVSNGLKYTMRGGVVVGWVNLGNELRVDVWDTGLGIPEEHTGKIFSEYYQVNNPGRDRTRGLGLGLSIVQRIQSILPRHHLAFSTRVGRGSRFSVYVPATTPGVTAMPKRVDPADRHDLQGVYAIVCDDEPVLLQGLAQLFRGAGALVDTVSCMAETESLLETTAREPDIVITDIRLKNNETGIKVAERIRAFWEANIPVVFVTGELIGRKALVEFPEPYVLIGKSTSARNMIDSAAHLIGADV
jgi:two-component system, sensor histidine kinase